MRFTERWSRSKLLISDCSRREVELQVYYTWNVVFDKQTDEIKIPTELSEGG